MALSVCCARDRPEALEASPAPAAAATATDGDAAAPLMIRGSDEQAVEEVQAFAESMGVHLHMAPDTGSEELPLAHAMETE